MATYKVPQDVEADDKLLGPFTFRQFIYLMIVFGSGMLAVALFQLFPLLAIIPLPFMIFFGLLALPLKKDQPMETYLAALLSFYTKPNKRYWLPGQSESTILITAPKQVEASRARDLSSEEASHRLSFLAEIVDSEGHAIKNANTTMKDEFYAEAYNTTDMFDANRSDNYNLNNIMIQQQQERREAVVNQMRNAIETSEYNYDNISNNNMIQLPGQRVIQPRAGFGTNDNGFSASGAPATTSGFESPTVIQPDLPAQTAITSAGLPSYDPLMDQQPVDFSTGQSSQTNQLSQPNPNQHTPQPVEDPQATADRIRRENESEVYVSLH